MTCGLQGMAWSSETSCRRRPRYARREARGGDARRAVSASPCAAEGPCRVGPGGAADIVEWHAPSPGRWRLAGAGQQRPPCPEELSEVPRDVEEHLRSPGVHWRMLMWQTAGPEFKPSCPPRKGSNVR